VKQMGAQYFNDLADIGDYDLGALGRRRNRKRSQGRGVPARRLVSNIPGVPTRGLREQPLPLGATQFNATSGTALSLSASPARPFRGRRLIVDFTRTNGTGAAQGLLTCTSLSVGADNQLPVPAGTGMPAAAFGATAVGVNLDMDPAGPGVGMSLGLAVSVAPTGTGTIDISALIIGETVG
jgi:hypothetical protein